MNFNLTATRKYFPGLIGSFCSVLVFCILFPEFHLVRVILVGLVRAKLRMFDKSELQTRGRITIAVEHPRTSRVYELEFYVAAKHEQPLLGFKACRLLELLHVAEENVCEVRWTAESRACITEAEILGEYAD